MNKYLRINLSFLELKEEDQEVYNIISSQRNKTDYVIKAVKFYENNRLEVSKSELLELFKEAISDLEIEVKDYKKVIDNANENQISDEMFDMINYL